MSALKTKKTHTVTKSTAQLLFASTHHSSDIYYLCKLSVPDPFIALKLNGKTYAVFNALEYSRAQKEAQVDHILSLEELSQEAKKKFPQLVSKVSHTALLVHHLTQKLRIKKLAVPTDFPAGLAFELQSLDHRIAAQPNPFLPERVIKSDLELKYIREGNKASAAGIAAAERILRESVIKGKKLFYKGTVLTSEILRTAINIACLEAGAVSSDTIAAGGIQACDPHCIGSGPLYANELIIVDVFPKMIKNHYNGDMTRTFLKGKPNEAQKKLVATVQKAQKAAFAQLKEGVTGNQVHQTVVDFFEAHGYTTAKKNNVYTGFFHGTGHGLGLDVHELPRVGSTGHEPFKSGMVITIEPGLYYPEIGGVRIEDVASIEKDGYKKLSSYSYNWILP